MVYSAVKEWNKEILRSKFAYPSEYVIRIFKGRYPRLDLSQNQFKNKNICDIGCGDGRNAVLLNELGFNIYGTDISRTICDKIISNLKNAGIDNVDIRPGTNDNIPFENDFFDYLLSWNSCYYMGSLRNFNSYVKEFARVLKSNGYLILSIPKKTCFIYRGSKEVEKGYRLIKNDPFKIRNGEVLRMFSTEHEIKKEFSAYFKNFIFASDHDDCFGLDYHWHLVVCRKK